MQTPAPAEPDAGPPTNSAFRGRASRASSRVFPISERGRTSSERGMTSFVSSMAESDLDDAPLAARRFGALSGARPSGGHREAARQHLRYVIFRTLIAHEVRGRQHITRQHTPARRSIEDPTHGPGRKRQSPVAARSATDRPIPPCGLFFPLRRRISIDVAASNTRSCAWVHAGIQGFFGDHLKGRSAGETAAGCGHCYEDSMV